MGGRLTRLMVAAGVLGAVVLSGVVEATPGTAAATGRIRHNQLIPLYDDGNPANWAAACSQSSGAGDGSWIIADVAKGDGAGSAPVASWASIIRDCYRYGKASVIGYVWTDYGRGGQASIASIERHIDNWYAFYPGNIGGIFFDGVSDSVPETGASNQSFYQALARYVHKTKGTNNEVVFNFGANPGSDWMLSGSSAVNADIVVTFEGSYDTPGLNPYTQWTQAAWERRYSAQDFAALIYAAPNSAATPQPGSACGRLATQNIRYIYVGTWYSELAPYFPLLASSC